MLRPVAVPLSLLNHTGSASYEQEHYDFTVLHD